MLKQTMRNFETGVFQNCTWGSVLFFLLSLSLYCLSRNKIGSGGEGMKAINLWDDETFLRHVMPPEEDRAHIYPSTSIEPRWFRSPNVIPIERHERFQRKKGQPASTYDQHPG
jgi:hypothetical protein